MRERKASVKPHMMVIHTSVLVSVTSFKIATHGTNMTVRNTSPFINPVNKTAEISFSVDPLNQTARITSPYVDPSNVTGIKLRSVTASAGISFTGVSPTTR